MRLAGRVLVNGEQRRYPAVVLIFLPNSLSWGLRGDEGDVDVATGLKKIIVTLNP